ncbi:hypothetical protein C7M84_015280, partial [Penaeus vannamei]
VLRKVTAPREVTYLRRRSFSRLARCGVTSQVCTRPADSLVHTTRFPVRCTRVALPTGYIIESQCGFPSAENCPSTERKDSLDLQYSRRHHALRMWLNVQMWVWNLLLWYDVQLLCLSQQEELCLSEWQLQR